MGARDIGWGAAWIPALAAALYVVGNVGGVGAWLTGPARVAFVIGLDRYFPPAFGRVHPRWQTPYVAILTQAVLATLFLFVSVLGKGTTVERAYLVILDTMLLVYFIPYIYLFVCYLVLRFREPVAVGAPLLAGRAPGTVIGLGRPGPHPVRDVHRDGPAAGTDRSPAVRAEGLGGAAFFVLAGSRLLLARAPVNGRAAAAAAVPATLALAISLGVAPSPPRSAPPCSSR